LQEGVNTSIIFREEELQFLSGYLKNKPQGATLNCILRVLGIGVEYKKKVGIWLSRKGKRYNIKKISQRRWGVEK